MRNWGLLLIVLGTTLYALYLRQRAGTDIASATPRDPRDPIEGGTGYFTIGLQLTGAGILFMFYWAKLRPYWRRILLVLALVSLFGLMTTQAGDRYLVLYLGFAILASYYLLANKPFGVRPMLFVLSLATFFVMGVGLLRGNDRPGVRQISTAQLSQFDPQAAFQRFFGSFGDVAIFDAFVRVISAIPDIFPYLFPGRTIAFLSIHLMPRILWEDKPLPTERLVNSYMIGEYGVIKAGGGNFPYSLPASFYVEGGVIAIIVGSILFGVICRAIWAYNIKHNNIGSIMLVSITLPTILFYQRDGITDSNMVWYLAYLLPAIVGLYYASVESRVGKEGSFAQNSLRDTTEHSSLP